MSQRRLVARLAAMVSSEPSEATMRRAEHLLEEFLFQSRWLLAPFYVGLVIGLFGLLIHFVRQLYEFVVHLPTVQAE